MPLKTMETWRTRMPRERQLAVTALTLPLVAHYHYPIHTASAARPSTRLLARIQGKVANVSTRCREPSSDGSNPRHEDAGLRR